MSDWTAALEEVNTPAGTGGLVIAHLHPGDVSASFAHSVIDTTLWDSQHQRRLTHNGRFGFTSQHTAAGRIASARNQAVERFLDTTDAEWLLFADSDMGWEPDAPERLIAAADPVERPVMGGLCFGAKLAGQGPAHAMRVHVFPTLYTWWDTGDACSFEAGYEWSRGKVIRVDATGAAFLLMHRGALERIREAEGDQWFSQFHERGNDWGEDLAFCRRLMRHGIPLHVHTGVGTSHKKDMWIDESMFDQLRRSASPAVSVVIPVKDNWEMTRKLVAQLVEQGGYDDLLIFDNGTTDPAMREWLDGPQTVATIFDASDAGGIHEMWDAGIEEARQRHNGRVDVVFLNNDLLLGPDFVRRLCAGLRSDPALCAVSGNYDGRRGHGVQRVQGICAGRYDGTGGLAGFAFAVRSDFLEAGYRFPTSMRWWYGDNDLCLSIDSTGNGWYGVVVDAEVEHLDGGSNTEPPPEFQAIIEADRRAFEEAWPQVHLVSAGA